MEKLDMDIEKLKYLLNVMYPSIELLVDQVLEDSKTNPEYSAVAATNAIKCYIQIMEELDDARPYVDIKGFFAHNGYTDSEYCLFEEVRKKESQYYRGIQY